MSATNDKINRQLRQQSLRRVLTVVIITVLFIGFMSYALYKAYGPDAEIVDYFPQVNSDEQSNE